ncbi:hypothetical protein JRQ81_008293 [Phrynocephalus forsythii]|uniref:DUF4637 domain-containing protein n=1 Tax=Phrynocephalus forsythii TaxID=171643 RepID=A0A9Q1ATF2_9SAUR|nr:hypothetical protein JRQ81_008293 [Phrynocephalus forsythii]
MSQRGEKEEEQKPEKQPRQELEEDETWDDAEPPGARSSARPSLTPSMAPSVRRESWLWSLLPLPLLSGLSWLGDRSKPFQEPLCCELDLGSTSTSGMCPECEITFCKKCEKLHYSRVFIEHGLFGHSPRNPPEGLSPTPSTDGMDLVPAPKETEDKEKEP